LSEASLENASKLKRFDDFKTMLSLNDKEETEDLPLKPTTQNDLINEEGAELIPRARSKRARRAPKAVYDNDFEAHEIQDVRVDSFFIIFFIVFLFSYISRQSIEFSKRGGLLSFTFTSSSRCFVRPSSYDCLVLLFLFLRMMILIFKHMKQCEY
jgi:hypothetical protein